MGQDVSVCECQICGMICTAGEFDEHVAAAHPSVSVDAPIKRMRMTATRLRQIADQLEKVCIERRKLLRFECVPCGECREMAWELRQLALEIGPPQTKGAAA